MEWWQTAVIYQIYPRSFADANGDGIGDLAGVKSRLYYLRQLGIDAIWFNPWYLSPQKDGGYDVADYFQIDPRLGTLADARELIAAAWAEGIRIIVDLVPNHVSDQHRWFQEALRAGPGSAARNRFWFRPGRGPAGEVPPNNWKSSFGGPAWTRVPDGEWYLHLFAPEQPDLNWNDPEVAAEFADVMRFWLDLGVAGFRVDSATMGAKNPALPDLTGPPDSYASGEHPIYDRDDVHRTYRNWRRLVDEYPGEPRILVGEVWLGDQSRVSRYLRPDEMHTVFNFELLNQPWDARALRDSIS
ncbi:MAG: alpha-amylase family glycosyl hydrolase, partial [Promicromonosporaceae bacterium]|nr:alpha-amylase family glycosyl hydrolase [Promicromonosporaceae bacterium]